MTTTDGNRANAAMDELQGLSDLEDLGLNIQDRAEYLIRKLESLKVIEEAEERRIIYSQEIEARKKQDDIEEWKDIGCVFDKRGEQNKRPRRPSRAGNGSAYKWHSNLTKQMNQARPSQWFEDAANEGLLDGNGECAKRLKQLAKKDRRKLKKSTESREDVKQQLGKDLWKHGVTGLSVAGKPRARKKAAVATPEVIQ